MKCEHCGSLEKWTDNIFPAHGYCLWFEEQADKMRAAGRSERDIADFRRSGCDAPCSCDVFNEMQEARERRANLWTLAAITGGLLILLIHLLP